MKPLTIAAAILALAASASAQMSIPQPDGSWIERVPAHTDANKSRVPLDRVEISPSPGMHFSATLIYPGMTVGDPYLLVWDLDYTGIMYLDDMTLYGGGGGFSGSHGGSWYGGSGVQVLNSTALSGVPRVIDSSTPRLLARFIGKGELGLTWDTGLTGLFGASGPNQPDFAWALPDFSGYSYDIHYFPSLK